MSLQMLRARPEQGIKVLRPRTSSKEQALPGRNKGKTQQLRQLCAEAQIDIMLYPGADELSFCRSWSDWRVLFKRRRYLLIDRRRQKSLPMPMNSAVHELEPKGITLILPSSERYQQSCAKAVTVAAAWHAYAVPAGSFTARSAGSVCENAKVLLANGLVDLLVGRAPQRDAIRYKTRAAAVIKQSSEKKHCSTETNPQAILKIRK